MRLKDILHSNDPYVNRSLDKSTRKSLERTLKNFIPIAGDMYEKINNIIDSEDNIEEAIDPIARFSHMASDLTVEEGLRIFQIGDHIATMRTVYSHHGIYDGYGGVYEYNDGYVRHSTLNDFAAKDKLYRVNESTVYPPNEIIARANSRLGESDYNILYNNCENFATWCRLGS